MGMTVGRITGWLKIPGVVDGGRKVMQKFNEVLEKIAA